jgi:hypothetical protein
MHRLNYCSTTTSLGFKISSNGHDAQQEIVQTGRVVGSTVASEVKHIQDVNKAHFIKPPPPTKEWQTVAPRKRRVKKQHVFTRLQ